MPLITALIKFLGSRGGRGGGGGRPRMSAEQKREQGYQTYFGKIPYLDEPEGPKKRPTVPTFQETLDRFNSTIGGDN